ncbi:UNVERIFIED_CONTAM: FT-interacting protein 1 [Sesamum radiatum]|uniref:FT-interacting protein 1 n=1 Tax=Sesamum radiatum TaxID=300843 RepID=A0AAW2LDS8_SESRA
MLTVAKYGQKWVRTRTIVQSLNPKWNEQYTWEVYDPCTVITLGVFDNSHLGGNDNRPWKGFKNRESKNSSFDFRNRQDLHSVLPPSCPATIWTEETGNSN